MSVADNLKVFLTDIWGEESNTIFLAVKPTPDTFKVSKAIVVPENLDTVVAFIIRESVNQDTYFTPGTFVEGSKGKEKGNGLRAKAVWVDIDGYHDGQGTVTEALELLQALGLPEPSYRIQSSQEGAEHWYWLLEEYAPAALINHVNQKLAYYLKGDKACWDISHVLRPPFTRNFKEEYNKPEVKIIRQDRKRIKLEIFKTVPKVKDAFTDFIEKPATLLTWHECAKMYPFSAEIFKLSELEKKDFKDFGGKAARGAAMVKMGYELAEVGASDDVIFSMLYYVDDKWEKFKDRPDRDKYIKDIVLRVRIKYPAMSFTQDPRTEETQLEPFESVKTIWGWKEFLESEFEYSWLIDGLFPDNAINFVSARPGVGKSRYTLQMACALGMGTEFLGYDVVGERKKVVYFSLEMGPPVLKYFVEGMTEALKTTIDIDVLEEQVKLLPMGNPLDLESAEGQQFFKYIMDEVKPDVVFIDALGSLTTDDLNEKASKTISTKLKEWLTSYSCTFFIIHHNRKELQAQPNKPPSLSDFYGNTFATTDAATIVSLWKAPNDEENDVQMHIVKGRTVKGDDKKAILLDGSQMAFLKKAEIDGDGKPTDNIKSYAAFNPNTAVQQFGLGFLGSDS